MGIKQKISLTWILYGASAVAFSLFLFWGFLILNSAATIADQTHKKNITALVQNEISRQVELMARDQSQISNWDATIEAVSGDLDRGFVRREIAEWLWEDFDIHDTIVIAPAGEPIVTVQRAELLQPEAGSDLVQQSRDLIATTTERYFETRTQTRSGFEFTEDPVRSGSEIYAYDFRLTGGEIGIVMAQAIVPSEGLILPPGNPYVLLTRKPLSAALFSEVRTKLGLTSFEIVRAADGAAADLTNSLSLSSRNDLFAVWTVAKPSTAIWQASQPLKLTTLALLAGVLILFSFKYGQALNRLRENEERSAYLAFHDPLTGLPNRAKLDQALMQVIDRQAQQNAAILCLDLDRFKPINDTWGHHAGDLVLQTVAERIGDVVGELGVVARVGGDEFTILIFDATDRQKVADLCDQIVSVVSRPISIDEMSVRVGTSIGVAVWTDKAISATELLREADQALYTAKNNGRGHAEIIDFEAVKKRSKPDSQKIA